MESRHRSSVLTLVCLAVPTLVLGSNLAIDTHVRTLALRCDSARHFNSDTWICEEAATVTPAALKFWSGTITRLGVTGFQYGTHLLKGRELDGNPERAPNPFGFALRSTSIDLDLWTGRPVIITGTPVAGYPIEGGPPLIDVTAIEFDQVMKIQ